MVTLDELLDVAEEQARDTLLIERKPELVATFILVGPQGEAAVCSCPWSGEFDKQMMLSEIRAKARSMGAVVLSHMSEAWMSPMYRTQAEVDAALPPSQLPDRREAIMIAATDGIATKVRILDIQRDWKGKVSALTNNPDSAVGQFAGRMIDGILPIGGRA
jgi:hypothetical protein